MIPNPGAQPGGPDVVEPDWAPLSDLLAALMLVFMLIAVLFARTVVDRASTAAEACNVQYEALVAAIGERAASWDIAILDDLTLRFRNPDLLFEAGGADPSATFVEAVASFFGDYIRLASEPPFADQVVELRVEATPRASTAPSTTSISRSVRTWRSRISAQAT